jgi:hypothetical protein
MHLYRILLIILFCGCNSTIKKQHTQISDDSLVLNSDTNQHSVRFINKEYIIDSSVIAYNKNLKNLMIDFDTTAILVGFKKELIPNKVFQFLNRDHNNNFYVADPEENWEATDAIGPGKYVNKKLLFVGKWKDKIMIAFQQGGIVLSTRIIYSSIQMILLRIFGT